MAYDPQSKVRTSCHGTWASSIVDGRGVHGSGWVGLRRFFNPRWVKKNTTQPTWIGLGRVEHMGLTVFIFLLLLLLN